MAPRNIFTRYDADLIVRSDDEGTPPAEPTGIEKMVADAVSDLRGFCDSMRADFDALRGRMDSMEGAKKADSIDEPDVSGVVVEEPTDGVVETKPGSELDKPSPTEGDRIGAAEAAIEGAKPLELAADAAPMDLDAMADSIRGKIEAPLRADIERLSRQIPAELTIEQRQQFADVQAQAEIAFQSFGDHAPAPMQGESIGTYKRRLAGKMQPHCEKWKGTKLTAIADDATLDVIVADIYNDAVAVARRGSDVKEGMLVPVTRRTEAGHTIREYRGSPGAWMRPLAGATRRATGKFNIGR